jgi:hypothetical protein
MKIIEMEPEAMPNIDVSLPVSAAPTDRLALSVSWVRPGAAGIATVDPSYFPGAGGCTVWCFEGADE